MRLSFDEMADITRAERQGGSSEIFERLSTDTRTLQPGDVFLALVGERFDGHDFLEAAEKAGARALIVEKKRCGKIQTTVPVLFVDDTLQALGDLAQAWRARFALPVVAVAGSNGKTTTRAMIGAILSQRFQLHQTPGNFNNLIGLPLTVLQLKSSHEAMLLELGMNARGEIDRLSEIAAPTLGLITNIGAEHLEFLHDLNTVAEAEGELFARLSSSALALVNADDPHCVRLANRDGKRPRHQLTFGWKQAGQIVVEKVLRADAAGSEVVVRDLRQNLSAALQIPVPGEHNIYNALAAAAVGFALGLTPQHLETGIRVFKPVGSRTRILPLAGGGMIIDDCYNANPSSMQAALDLTDRSAAKHLRRLGVLADMLELGAAARASHRELGMAAAKFLDGVAVLGEFAATTAQGAINSGLPANSVGIFSDGRPGKPSEAQVEAAAAWILQAVRAASQPPVILVKGSRGMALERVVAKLCEHLKVAIQPT